MHRLLALVGTVLSECAENSIVCRLGGDEFLLYMKEASRESAVACMEKIMKQFHQKKEEEVCGIS